jgi:CPA2 family monovalent cation:H+ antiporter-2
LAEQLSEVGVIQLMFGVGLHFHLKDLLSVRTIAVSGAVFQSLTATLLGAYLAHAVGWDWRAGVVYGLALSVASTVVLIRVLSDNGALHSPTGRVAVGWLVMEDIFTVFVLVLLPAMFSESAGATSLPMALGSAALSLGLFVAFMLVAGARVVPWLLTKVATTRSRELFTLSVLAVALGIAAGAAYFFGVSMALGAFLAGMVVGQSEFSARAGADALPMRDAFAVLFFVSIGMLFDPMEAIRSPLIILATLAIVMIGKPIAALAIVALLGYSSRIGLGVAIALAQIGEFSFLLANLGRQIGVLPEEAMNPIVAAAILSIMFNPMLYKTLGGLERFVAARLVLWRLLNPRAAQDRDIPDEQPTQDAVHRAVIVGFGPIGETVAKLLRGRAIESTIIEMNIATIHRLTQAGQRAVYGDANQLEVLQQAGIGSAISFILTSSGAVAATEAIRKAREINPRIHIVARADFLSDTDILRSVGADEVFSGEGEVALAMTDSILRDLGSTPEQLDEARESIRASLSKSNAS